MVRIMIDDDINKISIRIILKLVFINLLIFIKIVVIYWIDKNLV